MVNFEKVRIRMAGRSQANELRSLIELPKELPEEYADALLEELAGLLPKPAPKVKKTGEKIPVSRIGSTQITFGIHKGKTFDDVPLDYLNWLYHEQEEFMRSLGQYVNHPDLEQYRRGKP